MTECLRRVSLLSDDMGNPTTGSGGMFDEGAEQYTEVHAPKLFPLTGGSCFLAVQNIAAMPRLRTTGRSRRLDAPVYEM